jgi:hypothetical protein
MLRSEVESLRQRLAAPQFRATSAPPGSQDPSGDPGCASPSSKFFTEQEEQKRKIRDLEKTIKQKETMLDRLKKSWKETSQDFRELVHQWSGYAFAKETSDTYKLTPHYAESPGDCFLFRVSLSATHCCPFSDHSIMKPVHENFSVLFPTTQFRPM